MRNRIKPFHIAVFCIVAGAAIVLCALALPGCQPSPAVVADKAQITSYEAQIASLQKQIAIATTQPSATTQPLSALQSQLADLQAQLAATRTQLAGDLAAQKQSNLQTASQVTAAAGAVANAAPPPWGLIISGVLAVTSTVLGVLATKNGSALSTANKVIAEAAPGVAQLVGQVTKNPAIANDITTAAQISSGVIGLLNHPVAVQAVNAVTPAVPVVAASK